MGNNDNRLLNLSGTPVPLFGNSVNHRFDTALQASDPVENFWAGVGLPQVGQIPQGAAPEVPPGQRQQFGQKPQNPWTPEAVQALMKSMAETRRNTTAPADMWKAGAWASVPGSVGGAPAAPFSWNKTAPSNAYQMQPGEHPFAFAARQGNPQFQQNLDRNVAAASIANQQANGWNFPSRQTTQFLRQGIAPHQGGGGTLPMDNQGRGIYFSPNNQPGTAPQFHAPGSDTAAYNRQQVMPNMINQLQNQPANSQNTNWLNTMGQMFGAQYA